MTGKPVGIWEKQWDDSVKWVRSLLAQVEAVTNIAESGAGRL